ncbi:MAG: phosphate--nucleotide phosphotransferase [Flavobacteriaceae bacterium]|nr:MAG: phosphate--nucleotide phosphotransferase [Flavobacteriaceae bacterium]
MKKYKVNEAVIISELKTRVELKNAEKKLVKIRAKISKIQEAMYAEGKHSVLVCLQGMDTSGKDSLIREVFKDFNVRGINVHSFKSPSKLELKYDYLWRHYMALPERGKFSVFNRTHYENVLISRVRPEIVIAENIPGLATEAEITPELYVERMEAMVNFENHISNNGTIVIKVFLHLSKDEQKKRLLRRLNIKSKNWKFEPGDLKERRRWDDYQDCYQDILNNTSTEKAPWYVVPADDKPSSRLIVAEIILSILEKYNFKMPELPPKYKAEIENYKNELLHE